ncbi:hypothetical protein KY285_023116 [Solanum tuberosum]|nr:hypothetical protein KY285_023116 [Solanum tuberosum]
MEAEGDEASHHTQIPSTSSKESVLAIPTLPQELITAILFNDFVLWNPSTRKFKKVADVMPTQTFRFSFTCGFGYDEVHDDYKLVAIFRDIHVKIYSLKSDSWRALDDFQGEMVYNSLSKFLNGKLHWVTSVDDGWDIMSIDLVNEKWRKVEQPCYGWLKGVHLVPSRQSKSNEH